MTLDETRAIASLATIPGYRVLIGEVVRLKQASLERLKTARGQENIVQAAMEFRTWDEVAGILENMPREAVAELKEQKDEIYG